MGELSENSDMSRIFQNIGEEAGKKFMHSFAEIVQKMAKETKERSVSEKRSKLDKEEEEKLTQLIRFGPRYKEDPESIKKAKDEALNHVLQKSGSEAKGVYKTSLDINEAMKYYYKPDEEKLTPEEFREMMVRDGCFFLQLALHIVGGGHLLEYSAKHPYFGADTESTKWIPDMFFLGNQIPYDIIRALMEQTFFTDLINEGIHSRAWYCPDETKIAERALYLTVVKPAFRSGIKETKMDIIECLHSLFLGNGALGPNDSEIKGFEKLEAGNMDDDIKVRSAGELSKSGIKLATNCWICSFRSIFSNAENTPGIKNIHFHNLGYCAKIYLPTLTIHSYTKDILTQLVKYEKKLNESDREVTAYLRFMKDLVRTHDDFKILEEKKIIQVKDDKLKGNIIRMFDELDIANNFSFTLNFRHIIQKTKNYGGPPWRLISFILGFLTLIQTIFTILSYKSKK